MTIAADWIGGNVASQTSLRALVVDDSAVVRELIAVNLELEGFTVVTAGDGRTGMDLAVELCPDVITLDVMMPQLSGFETLTLLREDERTVDIPVVMVTGRAQAVDMARGLELGVDAYLTKPFEPAELVEVVKRLAGQGRTLPRRRASDG